LIKSGSRPVQSLPFRSPTRFLTKSNDARNSFAPTLAILRANPRPIPVDRFINPKGHSMVTRVPASIRSKPTFINDQLREAIWASGKSSYRLGVDTGVGQRVIDRFVSRKQDFRLETAAKIADALGLELRARDQMPAEPRQTRAGITNLAEGRAEWIE
jgi:DNA-binding phage protein